MRITNYTVKVECKKVILLSLVVLFAVICFAQPVNGQLSSSYSHRLDSPNAQMSRSNFLAYNNHSEDRSNGRPSGTDRQSGGFFSSVNFTELAIFVLTLIAIVTIAVSFVVYRFFFKASLYLGLIFFALNTIYYIYRLHINSFVDTLFNLLFLVAGAVVGWFTYMKRDKTDKPGSINMYQ